MNELLQPILALGGFGYLNYIIYSRIDNPDFGSENDKKFMIIMYSSLNYLVFVFLNQFYNIEMVGAIFYTILISLLFTFLFPILSRIFYKITNLYRMLLNLGELENSKLKDKFLEDNKNDVIFVFSIPDNELIVSGYKGGNSKDYEELSLKIINFYGNESYCRYIVEENLMNFLEDKKIEVDMYVNFDKKIKIISFPSAAEGLNSSEDE